MTDWPTCKVEISDTKDIEFFNKQVLNTLNKLTSVGELCFVLSSEAFTFQRFLCHLKLLDDGVVEPIPFAFVWI